jgi:hypothetical protein
MIAYANSKGIVVWVHAWWSRENMDKTIGEEKIIRWWRYLVNRLGAYNVIWSLAGEYNMYDYGGLGLEFWKKLGAMVKQEDPFGHITGTHVTPPNWSGGAQAPQWSTGDVMNSEPWLDYNQSQLGHGKYANEMAPMVIAQNYARHPVKPIVITEPWYEFREGNAPALDIRFAAWSALLSGAAGHTYGGGHAWLGNVPESPANVKEWPVENDPAFETYNYPGAVSMGVLAKVFSTIDWWTMVPMPQAVTDYPQPLCLAQPGKEYLVYLRYGGSFSIDLQDITSTSSFNVTWIDPSNGHRIPATQQVAGGKKTLLYSPSVYPDSIEYKDWVGFLKLAE